MAVGDVYKLDLFQLYAGQRIMNSLAIVRKSSAEPTQANCLALANDFKDNFRLHQMAQLSYTSWALTQLRGGTVSYTSIPCRRVGGARFDGNFTGTVVGSQVSDGLPPQVASVTTLTTGLSGRSKRGRFYMGGLPEGIQLDGKWNSGAVTAWQAMWDAFIAKYRNTGTDLDWGLGVWSTTIATGCKPNVNHPHNPTQLLAADPAAAFTYATAAKVRDIAYTQRRRTIGVGA